MPFRSKPYRTADQGDTMSRTKRITLGITAGALALGAGLGVTGMASAATTPSPSAPSSTSTDSSASTDGFRGHKRDRGQIAADLASQLGVDEAKVAEAIQAFREANRTTPAPTESTKPDRAAQDAAMAHSLATALGVGESKVTAALTEIRTAERAER